MWSKFKSVFLILFLFFYCDIVFCKAGDTTLHFIGKKLKRGDTLQYITIFEYFDWEAKTYKGKKELAHYKKCNPDTLDLDNADKIALKTNFEIDSNLLNKNFVFTYINEGSFLVRINGKEIVRIIKPLKINRFVLMEEEEQGYCYFTFPQKKISLEITAISADLSETFNGKFEIGELRWNDAKIEADNLNDRIGNSILFFYLAIGIVLLIFFLYYKQNTENFYFAFFCILSSLNLASDLFSLSSFVDSLIFSLSVYSMSFLANYLSIILTDKVRSKIPLTVFSIILLGSIIIQSVFQYYIVSIFIGIAGIVFLVYNAFICFYLLLQGGSRKKWEVKFITYGFFSALFFIIGVVIIVAIVNTNSNLDNNPIFIYSPIIGLIIIPLTIVVIIGKRNGLNQNKLIDQLSEIKILSEQNLKKEKEKQFILSEQNLVLEEKVKARTADLQQEKEIVEVKNREILDSIEYALRIQTAILPPSRIIKQYLINSFILYKPKDIVAGDFYWMETVDDLVLFAACDCTGHGVSGAMVSVLCNNALNRAVREFNLVQPAEILNKTAEIVVENFSKSDEKIQDGMDISICTYNTKTKILNWAGANNPLWLIKDGEFVEIKGDKQPVGMHDDYHPFTNHHILLTTGDSIYIFSDGYADQFGGENGDKKLSKKGFKEFILSIQNTTMHEQGKLLEKFAFDYRKEEAQTDDVLVMGVMV